MKKLPFWFRTGVRPAFYDMDSATAIEQTAKVYGAMQELITDYNKFVEELTKAFNEFECRNTEELECFKSCINRICKSYIDMMDIKSVEKASEITKELTTLIDNKFVELEEKLANSGGKMYMHTIKATLGGSKSAWFTITTSKSEPFTFSTLETMVKGWANAVVATSAFGIPASGYISDNTTGGTPVIGLGAMATAVGAPLALVVISSGKIESASLTSIDRDTVTEI